MAKRSLQPQNAQYTSKTCKQLREGSGERLLHRKVLTSRQGLASIVFLKLLGLRVKAAAKFRDARLG